MPNWSKEFYADYLARRSVPDAKQPELPQALASDSEGEAQSTGCIPVRFILYRCKLLDVDAKYASVKDLLDCVVAAGLVAGDKEGQVDLKVQQVKVNKKKDERTEIHVMIPDVNQNTMLIGTATPIAPPQEAPF